MLVLGANTWLVSAGWPLLTAEGAGIAPWVAGAVALGALVGGALLHGRGGAPTARARDALWWLAFPIATTAATARAYDPMGDAPLSPLPLLLAPLSACAFGAALATATGPAARAIDVELTPLRVSGQPSGRSTLRRALVPALFAAGALVLGLLLPALGDPAGLTARWGAGSRQGAMLSAVVGGALAIAVVASFLPAALRKDPRDLEPRPDAALRTAWYLFLALLGAVTYYVVQS